MAKASEPSAVTGPVQTIAKGPRQRALVAVGAAAIGSILAVTGFYATILAALDGGGSGRGISLVVLLVGLLLDLAAIVLAIIALVRAKDRRLPWIAIAVALIPVFVFVLLAVSARL